MIWKQFTHLGNFPPELKSRYNSFLTTEFDDSLSVEMQLRSIIKWCQENFDTVDTLINFINDISNWLKQFENDFGDRLGERVISVLSEWQQSGYINVVVSEAIEWELDDFKATTNQNFLTVNQELDDFKDEVQADKVSQNTINDTLQTAIDDINDEQSNQNNRMDESDNLITDIYTELGTQEQVNQNVIERFDNITIDITQEPYNVPTDPAIDATDALQNAFDTVPIRSKVLLPKGTYTISKPLVISRDLTIEGSGAGENGGTLIDVKFSAQYSNNHAINMKYTAKNGRLRNIYIRNSSEGISNLFGIGNTENEPALTHYEFYNIWAVGFTAGFNFHNIYLSTFKACYAVMGYYGFRFVGHSTSLVFEKCYGNKNTDNWYIENIIYSTFLSCASDGASRYGYYFNNVDSISMVACGAESCDMTGVYLNDTNAVSITSFFAIGCGLTEATGLGATLHVEPSCKGTVVSGLYEQGVAVGSPRTSSVVVTGSDSSSSVSGVVATRNIYTTPNIVLDGQKRSNIQPTTGTYKQGDFVYNTVSNDILGWKCTGAGTPGTWVVVNI